MLDHTRKLFKGAVTRAVYLTPEAGEGDAEALRTALSAPAVRRSQGRGWRNKPISFADLPALGTPGKAPVATGTAACWRIEQVDLGNGVKVLIWPTATNPAG